MRGRVDKTGPMEGKEREEQGNKVKPEEKETSRGQLEELMREEKRCGTSVLLQKQQTM